MICARPGAVCLAVGMGLASPAVRAEAAGPRPIRSDEAYATKLHRGLLARTPDDGELRTTLRELSEAPHRIVVHNRLLDSVEFGARVEDGAYLVGLYRQLRGRDPLAHEMVIGLHLLGEGVPRSEAFGSLIHAELPATRVTAELAGVYENLMLHFGSRRLERYDRAARAFAALDPPALRERLLEEIAELGGADPGPPGSWSAEGGPDPIYDVYYGYIHAHTRVSLDAKLQGSPGPFTAFDYARNVAGLDYLGLSDHAEYISVWPWSNEWNLLQSAVNAHNEDGAFVALRGFEYSNPIYGHLNVFNTSHFISTWAALTLPQFYAWLAFHPHAASTYNHPGRQDDWNLEFLHFGYFPAVAEQMMGIELLTHNDDYDKYSVGYVSHDGLGFMDEANSAGWRIASVSAQDNHSGGWGTIDTYRTAVLASELTQQAILDGLRQRRFYSTQDENLVMSFRADGREMGSRLGPGGKTFTVSLDDADGEGFTTIELYRNGLLFESASITGSGAWDLDVPAPAGNSYYYVLVTQSDGDRAMSAPIWVEGAD